MTLLSSPKPFVSAYHPSPRDKKFIASKDSKEAKKVCPWASVIVPHTQGDVEGQLAFKTVAAYSYWLSNKK